MSNKPKMSLKDAAEKFGGGNNDFFSLKDDGDTSTVRFMYEGEDDLDWYVVHPVDINEKKRWVLCTQEADCPLCKAGNKPILKMFLQLLDDEDGKVKTWERGKTFVPIIISLINRYEPLHKRQFEVERHGKKGDPKTTYQLYALDPDGKELSDLPEKQELVGENGFILDKSLEDMQAMADGTFEYEPVENPPAKGRTADKAPAKPARRRRTEGENVF